MRIVAYAKDRARLLANGEMAMTIYSRRDSADTGRYAYQDMCEAADLMSLLLSEPVMEAGPADCWGGRYITTRAGVFDKPAG